MATDCLVMLESYDESSEISNISVILRRSRLIKVIKSVQTYLAEHRLGSPIFHHTIYFKTIPAKTSYA